MVCQELLKCQENNYTKQGVSMNPQEWKVGQHTAGEGIHKAHPPIKSITPQIWLQIGPKVVSRLHPES
eukprot:2952979-Amphidinium_carterae.1